MARKRLTENHPVWKKVQQVFELMDQLGLRFEAPVGNVQPAKVYHDGKMYELLDLEDCGDGRNSVEDLPPVTEWKIVVDG